MKKKVLMAILMLLMVHGNVFAARPYTLTEPAITNPTISGGGTAILGLVTATTALYAQKLVVTETANFGSIGTTGADGTHYANFSNTGVENGGSVAGDLTINTGTNTFTYVDSAGEKTSIPLRADFVINQVSPTACVNAIPVNNLPGTVIPLFTVPDYSYPSGITLTSIAVHADQNIAFYLDADTRQDAGITISRRTWDWGSNTLGAQNVIACLTPTFVSALSTTSFFNDGTVVNSVTLLANDTIFMEAPPAPVRHTNNYLIWKFSGKGRVSDY